MMIVEGPVLGCLEDEWCKGGVKVEKGAVLS